MKSIRITFFVTGAILFSMLLGSLKAQAQVPHDYCSSDSKKLYMDIQIFNQTEKISSSQAVIGKRLEQDLDRLKMPEVSIQEKVHLLESSFARCYVDLTADEELAIEMNVEMFKKGNHASASED